MSIILDRSLAADGKRKIEWARATMPVLSQIEEEFKATKPLSGLRMTISIHLEAKTAYLAHVLRSGGAEVAVTGCNPLSTQDDVAASLVADGFEVFGIRGVSIAEYEEHLKAALSHKPHIIVDDGGDLVELLHGECRSYAENIIGGSEETTTGVMRLRQRAEKHELDFPMVAVNDANCKYLFDNRYGTGQSVFTALMQVTNRLVAGKTVVVAGYGWCGRGIAMRAAAMGAKVIVTEILPYRALEAAMDGYRVMKMDDAAPIGDIFITATGCRDVIRREHMLKMKNEVLLANAGHFDVEISKPDLDDISVKKYIRRDSIEGYELEDGRILNLIAEGRLVNLAAGNGHPAEIMDMSFAVQALAARYIAENGTSLSVGVHNVPEKLDEYVAVLKLNAMGLGIDTLSSEQKKYLGK